MCRPDAMRGCACDVNVQSDNIIIGSRFDALFVPSDLSNMTESMQSQSSRRRALQVVRSRPPRHVIVVAVCSLFILVTAPAVANEVAECTAHTSTPSEQMEDFDALQDRLSQELVDWVRSTEGGYINDKVQLRRGNDGDGPRGIYVNDAIEAGEIICTIPWSIIFQAISRRRRGRQVQHHDMAVR